MFCWFLLPVLKCCIVSSFGLLRLLDFARRRLDYPGSQIHWSYQHEATSTASTTAILGASKLLGVFERRKALCRWRHRHRRPHVWKPESRLTYFEGPFRATSKPASLSSFFLMHFSGRRGVSSSSPVDPGKLLIVHQGFSDLPHHPQASWWDRQPANFTWGLTLGFWDKHFFWGCMRKKRKRSVLVVLNIVASR